jgi:poly(hydroxyalkanoate) depolymerase family esterase
MHLNIAGWLLAGAGALLIVGELPGRAPALAELTRAPAALESTFSFGGKRRAYYVYRPSRLGATPSALVLALHADGSDARQLERISRLDEEADRYGFTVVYANAGRGAGGSQVWDPGTPGKTADGSFLQSVIDAVNGKYRIDPDRIYLTGQAAGGRLAVATLCANPDRFAGLALLDSSPPASCDNGAVLKAGSIASLFEVISNRD